MSVGCFQLFGLKPDILSITTQVCRRMLELQNQCTHPVTKRPYVKASSGGRDNSPEGQQGGFSHGFVVEFENEEDRGYYLEKDPAHLAFVQSLEGLLQRGQVIDYEPGIF